MTEFVPGTRVEILPASNRGTHGGPHRFVDGKCSCGFEEHPADEVELMPMDDEAMEERL